MTASANAATPATPRPTAANLLGTILVRLVVPVWVLIGAGVKLWQRNPQLLPTPLRELNKSLADVFHYDLVHGLDVMLRSFVAIEILLAGAMIFVPRFSRAAAIAVLSAFCLVLIALMAPLVADHGLVEGIKKGSCGCFGDKSPNPAVMFAIDFAMLLGVIFLKPIRSGVESFSKSLATTAGIGLMGVGLAFGMPERKVVRLQPAPDQPATAPDTTRAPDTTSNNGSGAGTAQPVTAAPWPPAPDKLRPTYYVDWKKKGIGTRLDSHPLALHISRPMPADINRGEWFIVFYRPDCEVCHALLSDDFFKGPAGQRTIAVKVPEKGGDLAFPCTDCLKHSLPEGPNYVNSTPELLKVIDGVIVAVCDDVEDPIKLQATFDAKAPGTATAPTTGPDATQAQPAASAERTPWPNAPELKGFYDTDFDKWPGTRLDSHEMLLQMTERPPADYDQGEWVVIFYRPDCDVCHEVLELFFTDETLAKRTIAIRVPVDEGGTELPMPCTECHIRHLPAEAGYLITTPVVVKLVDGVVRSVATDGTDLGAVEQTILAK